MQKRLVIIRGIPGSGKSTLARDLADANGPVGLYSPEDMERLCPVICEADDFFMETGKYHYIPHLVPTAHEWCRRRAERAMSKGVQMVIVSNTSTIRARGVDPYLEMAKKYDYTPQEIVVFGNFGSIHGVPDESLQTMRRQLRNSLVEEIKTGKLL